MIYIMSRYEKVDFLMYELQNGFRMALKPFNPPPPLPPLGGGGGRVFFCMRCTSLHLMHLTAPQFSGFLVFKLVFFFNYF